MMIGKNFWMRGLHILLLSALVPAVFAQTSKVWNPDNGDGTYSNPVLAADYSDPDVVRVGNDFYLVASSFDAVPGLPILHSTDLVHWEIVAHGFARQLPEDRYKVTQHGNGVWAPAIRYHEGKFYIFYPDPDLGIFVITANSITGPWSEPHMVKAAKGWIDPCPLWDDDGNAYLVNALAGTRAGAKSVILVNRMAPDGSRLLDDGAIIIDGHTIDPTIEGPKIYKRHGYYYIFAPAGGVPTGWQVIYRAKNIYGPYERRVVLAQGTTPTNGPHQGAWVDTPSGEDWFLHFQDQGPFGRVVHLEPMRWQEDWPVMGVHQNAEGVGEPVRRYKKPALKADTHAYNPLDSDEFAGAALGPQWQWQANPEPNWALPFPAQGVLRMVNVYQPAANPNLWETPNLLLQKFPSRGFTVTTKLAPHLAYAGEQTGLVVMGLDYSALIVRKTATGLELVQSTRVKAATSKTDEESAPVKVGEGDLYLRATVDAEGRVRFAYSADGTHFSAVGTVFQSTKGQWIGAKIGLFATSVKTGGEAGYSDFDWFRFER